MGVSVPRLVSMRRAPASSSARVAYGPAEIRW
jgi:hypothetical protein